RHRPRALPRLHGASPGTRRKGADVALLRRAAPVARLPLQGPDGATAARRSVDEAAYSLLARPGKEGLRAGPHAGARSRTLRMVGARRLFLRLRRCLTHG